MPSRKMQLLHSVRTGSNPALSRGKLPKQTSCYCCRELKLKSFSLQECHWVSSMFPLIALEIAMFLQAELERKRYEGLSML